MIEYFDGGAGLGVRGARRKHDEIFCHSAYPLGLETIIQRRLSKPLFYSRQSGRPRSFRAQVVPKTPNEVRHRKEVRDLW
jgi:hypothetical protein